MNNLSPFGCSVCTAHQVSPRGWRLVTTSRVIGSGPAFHCRPWDAELATTPHYRHVCGVRCSLVLFERFLETGSLDKPKTPRSEPVTDAAALAGAN